MSAGTSFSLAAKPFTAVFCGNSIGDVTGTATTSFVLQYAAMWQNRHNTIVDFMDASGPADTLALTITNYATVISPYIPAKTGKPLLVILPNTGGTDVFNGTSAAATYALMQTLVAAIRADGGLVMCATVTPGSLWSGAAETRRTTLNGLIAGDLTQFDFYWPMAAAFPDTTADYFQGDHQHLSDIGATQGAQDCLRAQDNVFAQLTPAREYLGNVAGSIFDIADGSGGFAGAGLRFSGGGRIQTGAGLGLYFRSCGQGFDYWTVGNTEIGKLYESGGLSIGTANAATDPGNGVVLADLMRLNSFTPASAAATGVANTIARDASFIYVCTATNTWKRVAIATW